MELRLLEYFLAVAREKNITAAAQSLHLSQPTLSRQLKDLEEELGKTLFVRGNRSITLTEEGIILCKRAEEILDLVHKAEKEIVQSNDTISGDIYIGAGESEGVRLLIQAASQIQKQYPNIYIHTISGDSIDLSEQLNNGLLDFAVLWEPVNLSSYESLELPYKDCISILMPKDCELAQKDKIYLTDLNNLPIIVSRQQMNNQIISKYSKKNNIKLNIVATYNLLFNASLMVEEGMGYAIGFDHIIDTTGNRNLITKPLYPINEVRMFLVWKKYQVFSKATQRFLNALIELTNSNT